MSSPQPPTTVYGKLTCADTIRSRALLDKNGMHYTWIDVESDPALAEEARRVSGDTRLPVLVVGERVFVEPTDEELASALAS